MMKNQIKNILRPWYKILKNHRIKHKLNILIFHKDPKIQTLGEAVLKSYIQRLTNEEKEWIELIEKRRSFLLASNEKVQEFENTEITISEKSKGSKSQYWATFLFLLVRNLKPISCIELGSCVGISAAYQSVALKMNGKGLLYTLEGMPDAAKIASETLAALKTNNTSVITGKFQKTLKGVLETITPVDYFFNDGHHDYKAVLQYFNLALPYLADGAIIVIDDITWSDGMKKAWIEIRKYPDVRVTIDLGSVGVMLITRKIEIQEKINIDL